MPPGTTVKHYRVRVTREARDDLRRLIDFFAARGVSSRRLEVGPRPGPVDDQLPPRRKPQAGHVSRSSTSGRFAGAASPTCQAFVTRAVTSASFAPSL